MRELVEAARNGDRRAQRALFDRFRRPLMGYCMLSANGDRELAMDLTQETFGKAFTNLDRLQDADRFKGWLFTIAANVCRTQGAKAIRQKRLHERFALVLDAEPPAEDKLGRELRISAVQNVLDSIEDDKLRKIVTLKYTEPEHTTREIASKLDIPHGTVTVTLSRFRARMKGRFAAALLEVEEACHG